MYAITYFENFLLRKVADETLNEMKCGMKGLFFCFFYILRAILGHIL